MQTFFCLHESDGLRTGLLNENGRHREETLTAREIGKFVPRREQRKIPQAAIMAGVLFEHFELNNMIRDLGGNPEQIPLVVCNRFANWDHVADAMAPSPVITARGIDSYVATAWFPAAVQGYLTIRYSNTAQAITLSTKSNPIVATMVDHLRSDALGGMAVLASFEYVPKRIGQSLVTGDVPQLYGAVSLITAQDSVAAIEIALSQHRAIAAGAIHRTPELV
ncbi:MAG TPA: hypothetical protein ENH56_10760 [Roseobacter sp.]|uniref:Uncharacterized protein n=1 Tax=marine sediment metagenome TaxID=412755 RepID=A0A0F9RKM2_9ZZZZ|nr:hypothetical protein [Roseobacter sp.]HEC71351.1 hypothetical protein [Roseobacter sp.]